MKKYYQNCINYLRQVNWMLLLFLVLMLNVKLVIKAAAILFILIAGYKRISFRKLPRFKLSYFYMAMIVIAGINFILQLNGTSRSYLVTAGIGFTLWIMAALACFFIYSLIQNDQPGRLHRTVEFFFILHIAAIGINLLLIMIETGSLNPYTYKGINQKYYINTGDYISGITFDSPVSTAMICAFALLYFLYQRRFVLSLFAMASLLTIGSNVTNLFFAAVLICIFFFRTDKIQKSLVTVYVCMLVLFVTKISPQNNEYVGRFAYKMIGKPYDKPKRNEAPEFLKEQPDSLLNQEEKRKKRAALVIDSSRAVEKFIAYSPSFTTKNPIEARLALLQKYPAPKDSVKIDPAFYEYEPAISVTNKISKYSEFLNREYAKDTARIKQTYDWDKPGKWIAGLQLIDFLRTHKGKIPFGAGIGNFSSRTAFKATGLGIAGTYPGKYIYIHPWFLENHLFVYVFYYSQQEQKHSAVNTPDSTYYHLLGEYGVVGILAFLLLYLGYFLKRVRYLRYGLPVLLLLLMAFLADYWFEQLSIVILAELLLLLDLRSSPNYKPVEEVQSE